jgi:predicted N-formylglutamate amidohydrolase
MALIVVPLVVVAFSIRWFWVEIGTEANRIDNLRRHGTAGRPDRQPIESVYLTKDDIERVRRSIHILVHSHGKVQWSGDPLHPDWSPNQLRDAVMRAGAVLRIPGGILPVADCIGVLLHPSGESQLDHGDLVYSVKDAALERHRVLTATAGEPVYLFRSDIHKLFHYNFYIAINNGYHRRYVHHRYPGWSWESLFEPVAAAVPYLKRRSTKVNGCGEIDGPPGNVIGVLVDQDGTVSIDDGSLEHPAKTFARQRRTPDQLAEQCYLIAGGFDLSAKYCSPVVVHVPHASRLVPTRVREDLCITAAEVEDELDVMTDTGVSAVIEALRVDPISETRPNIVAATMSRLVFDPERFETNDPMEDVGMGMVYANRADGNLLRRELTPERREWYRNQYRSYTSSLEQIIAAAISKLGAAVIIDLHSYPTHPLRYEDADRSRPEICVGVDRHHTPAWLVDAAGLAFSKFDVGYNTPFEGAYVPGRWYLSERPVYSVMIEVRRDVLASKRGVTRVASAISVLIQEIERYVGSVVESGAGSKAATSVGGVE